MLATMVEGCSKGGLCLCRRPEHGRHLPRPAVRHTGQHQLLRCQPGQHRDRLLRHGYWCWWGPSHPLSHAQLSGQAQVQDLLVVQQLNVNSESQADSLPEAGYLKQVYPTALPVLLGAPPLALAAVCRWRTLHCRVHKGTAVLMLRLYSLAIFKFAGHRALCAAISLQRAAFIRPSHTLSADPHLLGPELAWA